MIKLNPQLVRELLGLVQDEFSKTRRSVDWPVEELASDVDLLRDLARATAISRIMSSEFAEDEDKLSQVRNLQLGLWLKERGMHPDVIEVLG